MNIEIARADPHEPALRKLIADLDASQQTLYPAESNHLVDIETLAGPDVHFFACAVDGKIVGCGGVWMHEGYAEVKRVYVDPSARGLGLAKKIMAVLAADAMAMGMRIARLETGIHQPEALGLYRGLGYTDRGSFGDYPADDPMSVFMEKAL